MATATKLHYFDFPGKANAIRLAIRLGSVPIEDVQFPRAELATMKQKSPTGLFPILEFSDGSTMIESVAILLYVCSLANKDLIPEDPVVYGAAMMMVRYMENTWAAVYAARDSVEDMAERKVAMLKAFKTIVDTQFKELYSMYKQFAPKTNTKFLFGDRPTFADLYIGGVILGWLNPKSPFRLPEDEIQTVPKFIEITRNLATIPELKTSVEETVLTLS